MTKRLHYNLILFLLTLSVTGWSQSEPANHVTGLTATTSGTTSISLSWTGATGSPAPEFYLVVGRKLPAGTFAGVADGPVVADDSDWSDDNFATNLSFGINNLSVTGLEPASQYEFRVYPYRENAGNANFKTDSPPTASAFTLSTEPSGHSTTFTATLNGTTTIDLVFDAANTLTNADGYLIYRRAGSAVNLTGLNDGAAPPTPLNSATLIQTTTATATDFSDAGLQGGVTYHYALVPFNFNGSNVETYNFLNNGAAPAASAVTTLLISITQITGPGSNIATSPLNSGATNQAILGFSITTNGPTTFNALNVALTTTATGKFLNPRIFKSTDAAFGGDANISTGTIGAQLQFTGIGDVLSGAGTTNYFIVVNVDPVVNAGTPSIQPSFTQANITFISPAVIPGPEVITGTDYSFVDATPPSISSTIPADNATNVSVLLNTLQIIFNENVVHIGDNSNTDNQIRIRNITTSSFTETIPLANIGVAGNIVTLTFTSSLTAGTNYAIRIGNSVFEDIAGNNFIGITNDTDWNFQTEAAPTFLPTTALTRCIGDVVTITGSNFTGTGGTGNTQPFVFIDGVQVPAGNISPGHNSTSFTFTVPTNAPTGSGVITVQNRDNFVISSNDRPITVHPQIDTSLPVIPATLSPAQNTSVNIQIQNTQSNSYTYSLIANSTPGGYTATTQNTTGNNGTRTLTTTPALSQIGDYTYRIDVSRTGCTTRTLANTPFTLTVAPLSVSVNATSTNVCQGSSTILIGSTGGGTGFYQFSWSGPDGFSNNSSSPTLTPSHPSGTGWYVLTLNDNSSNIAKDSIFITTFAAITVTFIPIPGETNVRTNYTLENNDFRLYSNPSGPNAVFVGQGVTLKSDGFYYFNPFNAGVGNKTITLTYTDANGCQAQDTRIFTVSNFSVNNLKEVYCRAENTQLNLTVNYPNSGVTKDGSNGWQFSRLIFYNGACYLGDLANSQCGIANPLTQTSQETVVPLPGFAAQIPLSYSLNINAIRSSHGYSYEANQLRPGFQNYFYILIYGRNALGTENLRSFQFFRIVDNGPVPSIVGINELENVCSSGQEIELLSSIENYAISNFSISPAAYSASLSGVNFRDFNPNHSSLTSSAESELSLAISMNFLDNNNCPNSTTRNFTWIKKPQPPIAPSVEFCQVTNPSSFTITASPNGSANNPRWYNLDPLNPAATLLDSINFPFTAPGINGTTPTIQIFYVTQVYKGCEGDVTPVTIEIKPAPNSTFTPPTSICAGRPFTIVGPIDTDLGSPYKSYKWNFGDLNTAAVTDNNEVTHSYPITSGNQPFRISLLVTTDRDCENEFNTIITVGLNPEPDFSVAQICENDQTQLSATTSIVEATSFSWDFGDSAPTFGQGAAGTSFPTGGTFQGPQHQFTDGAGVYNVSLTAFTAIGCSNSIIKPVRILEYLTLTSAYNMQGLDNGRGFWTLEDINGNSTWQFNQPTTTLFSQFGAHAWVTNSSGLYQENEKSFINSPCFDFTAISRPAISLDYIINARDRVDGATLEYSNNGGLSWESLGNLNSGLDWFNSTGFVLGNIGSSPVGWSGETETSIKTGRHALDIVSNKTKARLRIAFSSGPQGTNPIAQEGFAFRNVVIDSRSRNLLFENFTQETFTTNNNTFRDIPATEGTKLQYHIGFPGDDNIHVQNTADPNARAAYYGITNSAGLVPRAYVDGYSDGNFTGSWNSLYRGLRSLAPSPVTIGITTLVPASPEELQFRVSITPATASSEIPAGTKPVLHVIIIEKVVNTSNHFVVKKMIPNAAGRQLTVPVNATITESYTWKPESPNFVRNQIAIVAFVQDEVTKEVYQAAELLNPDINHIPNPAIITSIEDPTFAASIQVFPNPANHEVNVVLPQAARTTVPVVLVDAQGRQVYTGKFNAGEQQKTIITTEMAGGLYVLHVQTPEGSARKKVMVVHEK